MVRDSITLRDVYDIVNRLESKMDTQFEKHEERINKIENAQSKELGILSVISLVVSGSMTYIWDRIFNPK